VSVYDKAGLDQLATALKAAGIEVVSTGGTARALEAHGVKVTDVAAVTDWMHESYSRADALFALEPGMPFERCATRVPVPPIARRGAERRDALREAEAIIAQARATSSASAAVVVPGRGCVLVPCADAKADRANSCAIIVFLLLLLVGIGIGGGGGVGVAAIAPRAAAGARAGDARRA
jgi:hypothetical protein